MVDIGDFRFGVATASLGMAALHTLELKFAALQKSGFTCCELGFGEYVAWVRRRCPHLPPSTCPPEWCEGDEPDPSDGEIWEAMDAQAPRLIALAESFGLTIMALQPLNQFDGWPEGCERAEWVRRKAERWLPLCAQLGVKLLQVGSNDLAEANAPDEKTAADLHWLAELGARQSPPVRIAYESWCFSKRVNTWEHTWELVQMGNHPNLGLCLDVAHFPLAPSYGWDPLTGEGWTESDYEKLIARLRTVPAEKIFYVELSDVLKPVIPLGQGSDFDAWREKNRPSRGDNFVWVICGRPVPFVGKSAGKSVNSNDDMGGGRVLESVKAILSTGFKGLVMFEFFEAVVMEREDPSIPEIYAEACATSQRIFSKAIEGM
ncbi:hypothetical protein W97_07756 [Coniosporium apollinis CBS 100218]|uniref:Xylose isomerase-like TIM barrel domain-containing protein n=1 Tax=Coniosporium apollinis (strain CBS 100218) TaxID=1168221 RepID=R7Z2N9_CONA1|nr:uncharacterized protein W97_07756 [Coniosporium apollinis CBS 100218]EON68432.1 hypothetical protein W97_07756 [Coniosporium apollinis CBS 100218]